MLPIIVALVALTVALLRATPQHAIEDSTLYLGFAHGIQTHGVYGQATYPDAPPEPSMFSPPLYPLLLAAVLEVDQGFRDYTACRFAHPLTDDDPCGPSEDVLIVVQSILAAVAVAFVYLTAQLITGSTLAGLIAAAFAVRGYVQWVDLVLTEALYLPLITAALYFLLRGNRAGHRGWIVAAGATMGLVALTRPSFLYIGIAMALVVALGWRFDGSNRRRGVAKTIGAYILPLLVVCAPWVVRNAIDLGRPAFTANYQNRALSARLTYNEMTAREWVTGFLYWMPDGGHIATPIMGRDSWRRLDFDDPTGFYRNIMPFRARLVAESGVASNIFDVKGAGDGDRMSQWLVGRYLIEGLPKHLAVTVLLAWRGALIEKWGGFVGLFALIGYMAAGRPKRARWSLWIVAVPGLLNLGFNAFFTLDIPRYNYMLLVPYSTALGWALASVARGITRRLGLQPSLRIGTNAF